MKKALLIIAALVLGGCASIMQWFAGPEIVVWKTPSMSQEWVDRQVGNVGGTPKSCTVVEVGIAAQYFESSDRTRSRRSTENFVLAAAYNKNTRKFSAEWGYAPTGDPGHNGVQLDFAASTNSLWAIGTCIGRHPVAYELTPDLSSISMFWGAEFESGAPHHIRVTWEPMVKRD